MKFNLKIVAAFGAVAMMSAGAAMAAPVTNATVSMPGGPYVYSKEGLNLTGTNPVTLEPIQVEFGNNLSNQDPFTITINGGVVSLDAAVVPGLIACTTGGVPNNTAVTYVKTVTGGWQFRIATVNGVSIGDVCTFTGLQVQGASLAGATTLSYTAYAFQTSDVVDSAKGTTDISTKSQFDVTVEHALNGEIDVYADRKVFSQDEGTPPGDGAAAPNQADTLNFTTIVDGDDEDFTGPTVTTTKQWVTIAGNFNWVNGYDNTGTCNAADFNAALNLYAGWAVDSTSDCTKVVLTSASSANTTNNGYFYVPGNVILDPTDYTATAQFDYQLTIGSGTYKNSKLIPFEPGAWTINGAQVYIQYMPYGTGISRIIYAANTGLINAEVDADVYYAGQMYPCKAMGGVGAVKSKTVNELSGLIDACVAAKTGLTSGKVSIKLTFTAPDKDIEVYSAYNVGGNDRGTVVNTSNGRMFFYGTGAPFAPPAP